jgi:rhodanese-related sulfurtransferase
MEGAYGSAERGAASDFGMELPPDSLGVAQIALAIALDGDRPVLLGSSLPMRSIIAALLLSRAGIRLDDIYRGCLSDAQFVALADTLRAVKMSKLLIESPDGQPGADAGAD